LIITQHLNLGLPISRDDIIEIFHVAAQRCRAAIPTTSLSDPAKLHWSLVAFRANRNGNQAAVLRAQRAYPGLQLDTLEEDIGSLTVAVAEHQLQAHRADDTPFRSTRRGEAGGAAFMAKIALWRKHTPRSRFFHIKAQSGAHYTSDDDMASAIRAHWKTVFQAKGKGIKHLHDMDELLNLVPAAVGVCDDPFDMEDIQLSLRRHDSAPGPDGLCYSAWRAAGTTGSSIILNAALAMWNGSPAPDSFRQSLMVFLPKSDAVALAPDELRPLSLCDVDYKVIMGCINHRLAALLPDYVDDRQRGFMKNRLGLDNLLLLEAAAMLAARSGSSAPTLCFLDIAAAFPSILHDYMLAVVRRFLGSHPLGVMIESMYQDTQCSMIIRGSVYVGFQILCGVRQGCPLSGSLFALAFHPIIIHMSNTLHRQAMHIGHDIFAYADDLALVLYDFWRQLQGLANALDTIAAGAGLLISWRKVQLVPLQRSVDLAAFRRRLSATRPAWAQAKIKLQAKYLGILLGPEVTDKMNMQAAFDKYLERCRFIARLGMGWIKAASLHNIFALPVLSYIAQVQGDNGIDEIDLDRAVAILFKGPMYRPPYRYFARLHQLGIRLGLKDIRLECRAAAARASLSLTALAQARRTMTQGSDDDHLRLHPHRTWQERSATAFLGKMHDHLRQAGPATLQPPLLQRKCKLYLAESVPNLNYHDLIKARLTTVLQQNQVECNNVLTMMATYALDTIILATAILS
jgi:hypothetical protein